jgi:DNA-binding beta-propeller fold protein YncE
MPTPRILLSTFGACAVFLLTAYSNFDSRATLSAQTAAKVANPITGEGLPNPAPKVTRNWGELPAGRKWGTSAGLDVDPKDGHIWGYERCGAGTLGGAGGGGTTCETNDVDPVFKFDRNTGKVLANFGKGLMVTPHGIHVDRQGNVWIADFAGNKEGTKGHQVHKFSPKGEKLLSLGIAGKAGNADGEFNQPNDVAVGPDGSIYVSDGHDAQGMTTNAAIAEGLKRGATSRISKFSPDGKFIKSWGTIGVRHGEFRTPHALMEGKYLESRYMYGRISGFFIKDNQVYAIDSESGPLNHPNWRNGVRIGPLDEDRITAFIPPFEREDRVYQGTAGEGIAVDADGNVYAAEGPNSLTQAGGAFTKYSVK